ncbi:MAG: hypothetical protein ACREJC_15965 [Tepidisphaeraceae bacterium]
MADRIQVVQVGVAGPTGPPSTQALALIATYDAAGPISAHMAVTVDVNGRLIHASADDAAKIDVIGLSLNSAVLLGDQVNVLLNGDIVHSGWSWTVPGPVYLGLNGVLTQVVPSQPVSDFQVVIGIATDVTRLSVDCEEAVSLA